jgi:hypothetical protein
VGFTKDELLQEAPLERSKKLKCDQFDVEQELEDVDYAVEPLQ